MPFCGIFPLKIFRHDLRLRSWLHPQLLQVVGGCQRNYGADAATAAAATERRWRTNGWIDGRTDRRTDGRMWRRRRRLRSLLASVRAGSKQRPTASAVNGFMSPVARYIPPASVRKRRRRRLNRLPWQRCLRRSRDATCSPARISIRRRRGWAVLGALGGLSARRRTAGGLHFSGGTRRHLQRHSRSSSRRLATTTIRYLIAAAAARRRDNWMESVIASSYLNVRQVTRCHLYLVVGPRQTSPKPIITNTASEETCDCGTGAIYNQMQRPSTLKFSASSSLVFTSVQVVSMRI